VILIPQPQADKPNIIVEPQPMKPLSINQVELRTRFIKSKFTIAEYQQRSHTIYSYALSSHIHKLSKCITKAQNGYIIKTREADNNIKYDILAGSQAKDYFRTTIIIQHQIITTKIVRGKEVKEARVKQKGHKIN
jgi:hypothetical protein